MNPQYRLVFAMVITAFMRMLLGMEPDPITIWLTVLPSLAWMTSFALFLHSNLTGTSADLLPCCCAAVCIGSVLLFISTQLSIPARGLPAFIPMGVNIGLLLYYTLKTLFEAFPQYTHSIQVGVRDVLAAVIARLPSDDPPGLPLFHPPGGLDPRRLLGPRVEYARLPALPPAEEQDDIPEEVLD